MVGTGAAGSGDPGRVGFSPAPGEGRGAERLPRQEPQPDSAIDFISDFASAMIVSMLSSV